MQTLIKGTIPQDSLTIRVYEILRDKITHEAMPQGEVFSIAAIAADLNVSRTPVHAACQKLECEGFLTILPKQGILVNPMTIDIARETYEMRAAIETYVFKRAFPIINNADLLFLDESCKKQELAVSKHDIPTFMNEDTLFHKYLISRYNNSQAFSLLENIYARAYQIGVLACANCNRLETSFSEHLAIVEYIRQRDLAGAVDAIERNILNGYVSLTGGYQI